MKLSVYLMRESVADFDQVIIERYKQGEQPFVEVPPKSGLDFECTAFIQASKEKPPKWLDFLSSGFDLSEFDMVNTSNSFVLLVKNSERIFAFTFGYGYSAVDKALIESGFGLKVTLNSISATALDTIDTRNIDLVTRQTRTHISLASPIYEFGINTTMDWIRFASGKPDEESPVTRYSGSDSLQASFEELGITELGSICEEFYECWISDNYKTRFPFIDYLRKLPKDDFMTRRLESELKRKIDTRSIEKIALAHPEIPNQEIELYKIWIGRKTRSTYELDLSELYLFLDELKRDQECLGFGFEDVNIIGLDSDGNPKTQKRVVKDYIVCEVDVDGQRFIHSLNEWFVVANDYMDEIKEKIHFLELPETELKLPRIGNGESEGDYNERVSVEMDFLLLDKEAFIFDGYRNRIEACDLATIDGDLIAVKKMSSSATLSHLFAQGSVSAKLLKLDSRYKGILQGKLHEKWNEFNIPVDNLRFVFAIPSKKPGSLAETMFFFSMVNLIDHVDTIRLAGFPVCIKKIEYS